MRSGPLVSDVYMDFTLNTLIDRTLNWPIVQHTLESEGKREADDRCGIFRALYLLLCWGASCGADILEVNN